MTRWRPTLYFVIGAIVAMGLLLWLLSMGGATS
jgi:hypothetical protein